MPRGISRSGTTSQATPIDLTGTAGQNPPMSPTVFRHGPYRFYFFSREEARIHVHVQSAAGEAKFWLEPEIELAQNYG